MGDEHSNPPLPDHICSTLILMIGVALRAKWQSTIATSSLSRQNASQPAVNREVAAYTRFGSLPFEADLESEIADSSRPENDFGRVIFFDRDAGEDTTGR